MWARGGGVGWGVGGPTGSHWRANYVAPCRSSQPQQQAQLGRLTVDIARRVDPKCNLDRTQPDGEGRPALDPNCFSF